MHAPATAAIAVSWLGGRASFVGKLGADEFGVMLAGILKDNGVHAMIKLWFLIPQPLTGLSLVTLNYKRRRRSILVLPASERRHAAYQG